MNPDLKITEQISQKTNAVSHCEYMVGNSLACTIDIIFVLQVQIKLFMQKWYKMWLDMQKVHLLYDLNR